MNWSFKIARFANIDLRVHWTFAILLVWLAVLNLTSGKSLLESAVGIGFVLAIFACVVLHEFGHALAARRFGIPTMDITLLPIGGIARLERIPEDPWQEFVIAVAGPLVNVAIAAVLFLALWLSNGLSFVAVDSTFGQQFWMSLLTVNIILVVFNCIPAFPMDGGRVLRALLATTMDYPRATRIAARVGQAFAIGIGIFGLFFNWFLIIIALFIYSAAASESMSVTTRSMLAGVRVRDAMMSRFVFVSSTDTVDSVVDELLAGDQHDFPVVEDDRVLGMLYRKDVIEAISNGRLRSLATSVMQTDCESVVETDLLLDVLEKMKLSACSAVPVFRRGKLVGLLTQENISEWLMIQTAIGDSAQRSAPVDSGPQSLTGRQQQIGSPRAI